MVIKVSILFHSTPLTSAVLTFVIKSKHLACKVGVASVFIFNFFSESHNSGLFTSRSIELFLRDSLIFSACPTVGSSANVNCSNNAVPSLIFLASAGSSVSSVNFPVCFACFFFFNMH